MRRFDQVKLYTPAVDGIRFPQKTKEPVVWVYFSENSTLLDDYEKLNLKLIDFKYVITPVTKIPRSRLTADERALYRTKKLIALSSNQKIPDNRNLIYDLTAYLKVMDEAFKPNNYRQRSGYLLKNLLLKVFSSFPPNYKKVLVYSVDTTQDLKKFINRKIYPILQQIKIEEFPFDHLILNTIGHSGSSYRLLIKNKSHQFPRTLRYLKTIKGVATAEEEEKEIETASNIVMKKVSKDIAPGTKEKVKAAVVSFLKKSEDDTTKVLSQTTKDHEHERIATASILYRTSGNLDKARKISKQVPKAKTSKVLQVVDKRYADEMLSSIGATTLSDAPAVTAQDPVRLIDDKAPDHLFQKRQIDFEINLKKDMTNSFKVLQRKDIPLKTAKMEITPKAQRKGELEKSDLSTINTVLIDKYNRKHVIKIDIPKIDPKSGTFRLNGKKKCLINQIVLCPIAFPKPYESRFESSYAAFRIESKRTKRQKYLELYMGSYRIPFLIALAFSFGFEESLKRYGITYSLTTIKPKKEEISVKLDNENYLIFGNVDNELKEELVQSFVKADIPKQAHKLNFDKFPTKEYFNDLIIEMTGRVASTFQLTSALENIVDPVARQVLVNMQLPSDLEMIMFYMASKVVTGFVQDRKDLANQRIRNSEVLVHLAQKQILAAYTEYSAQVLSGNKNAKFNIPQGKVLSDFMNSQVVQDMEYANPVEEMATISKVSPVGKGIGGIPDKRAVQIEGRNVHQSYFGNIDPLDTPEGDMVGISQQLTVDAFITSARGLITPKEVNNDENSGLLSTSTCLIPFIGNNDGARVLMAANQIKQALPLKNPTPPCIQTGYESILTNVLSDSFIKRSPCDGKVSNVSENNIVITCKTGGRRRVDISPAHLHSGSGKDTLSVFSPNVKVGQTIKKNSVIAEGSCISEGAISLGRNLCVAIMPYKGYNFEDGAVINERLIENDSLTSLHGEEVEVLVAQADRITYINTIGAQTEKGEPLIRKTIGDLEELLGVEEYEDDESLEITAGQFIKKSPGGTIVDIDVFSNVAASAFPRLKDLIEKTNRKYGKLPKEKFTLRGVSIKGILIKFRIEQELRISAPDKICNRHGNKGIISLVEKDEFMPTTPWGDKVDVIFNPLGIISRMNLGQMYELYCGLVSKELATRMVKLNDKEKVTRLLSSVISKLDTSKNHQYSSRFKAKLTAMSSLQFRKMIEQTNTSGFFPLVMTPFKTPNYKELMGVMNSLNLETGYKLKLPEFNTTTKHNVPVGYMYIYKLEHIGSMKIHGRSIGPKTGKTLQPTSGKKRDGGQRIGEGDTQALISYNCTALLAEFLGPLSDDLVTKNEIISDIIQTGNAPYRVAKTSPARELLNSYFISLMLSR